MDAITTPPAPVNEPNLNYAPGSPERAAIEAELAHLGASPLDLTATIGGRKVMGGGAEIEVVQPHEHKSVLGVLKNSTRRDAQAAVKAASDAAPAWRAMSYDDRASIILKAADLLAGPWRAKLNAATMLGQSKTVWQAEIDAACELIDFWRFNVHYGRQIMAEQPIANSPGVWNRTDHRPLEGFVYAITPFNFTAIAGNLPTAPALMGNTVIWKPSPTQQFAAHLTMELLEEAGLPPGVINMLPGDGIEVSDVVLHHPDLAGIHFTGSTPTFQKLWGTVGEKLSTYRSYPRIVGETGGKDFIVAHPSADVDVLRVAMMRGCLRVPGTEVLGRVARLRARVGLEEAQGPARRGDREPHHGPDHRPVELHGSRDRRPGLRQAQEGDHPRQALLASSTSSPGARSTTRSATSCGRRSWSPPTRPTRCSRTSTSGRSSPCTCTTTAGSSPSSTRWSRSRRTP